ncbi:MAG: ComEC/Rec2 family competence protein [Spirochaetales bacterium]|nr:ComEC/Rec2 family competence protein [Spirochaetales bacterium]
MTRRITPVPAVSCALATLVVVYLPPGYQSRFVALAAMLAATLLMALSMVVAPRVSPRWLRVFAPVALGVCLGVAAHGRVEALAGRCSPGFAEYGLLRVLACEGRLVADERTTTRGLRALELELTAVLGPDGARVTASGKLSVYARAERGVTATPVLRGQVVRVELAKALLPPRTGQGAWPDLLAPRSAFVDATDVQAIASPSRLEAVRARVRAAMLTGLSRAGGEAGPLLEALVVGVRDDLDPALAEGFRAAGCAHILALSGQHVGILASFASLLLGFVLGPFRARAAAAVLAGVYLYVVGPSPSVARAVGMFWVASVAVALDRPQPTLAVLATVALAAVALDPASLHSLSFKLSYLAVAGIAVYSRSFDFALRRWVPPLVSPVVAMGFAALAATAPLTIFIFGVLNPFSPLTSAVAGVLVTALMWSGIVGSVLVSLAPFTAELTALVCQVPHGALGFVIDRAARLPSLTVGCGMGADDMATRVALAVVVALGAALVYALPYASRLARTLERTRTRSLRLPLGTISPPRKPWPRDAQKVRAKLPGKRQREAARRRPVRNGSRRQGVGNRARHRSDDA